MAKKRICKICGENEATCPDRNYQGIGRLTLEVCGICHGVRLRGDMAHIMEVHRENEAVLEDTPGGGMFSQSEITKTCA